MPSDFSHDVVLHAWIVGAIATYQQELTILFREQASDAHQGVLNESRWLSIYRCHAKLMSLEYQRDHYNHTTHTFFAPEPGHYDPPEVCDA